MNMTMRRMTMAAVVAALLSGPVVLGGCAQVPVFMFSRQQEIEMGRQAAPEFEKEFGGLVDNQQLQSYVSSVGQSVASQAQTDYPFQFAVLNSDTPNAFALPGGPVYVTAGLMKLMDNERQLAAVLGHEAGHVVLQHSAKQIQRQVGFEVLAELAGAAAGDKSGSIAKAATQVAGAMANLKYSRGAESEADAAGIEYMSLAGYNPWGMVDLLETLQGDSESQPGMLDELLSTHPLTSRRIEDAEGIITAKESYRRFSQDDADPQVARFLQMRSLLH